MGGPVGWLIGAEGTARLGTPSNARTEGGIAAQTIGACAVPAARTRRQKCVSWGEFGPPMGKEASAAAAAGPDAAELAVAEERAET